MLIALLRASATMTCSPPERSTMSRASPPRWLSSTRMEKSSFVPLPSALATCVTRSTENRGPKHTSSSVFVYALMVGQPRRSRDRKSCGPEGLRQRLPIEQLVVQALEAQADVRQRVRFACNSARRRSSSCKPDSTRAMTPIRRSRSARRSASSVRSCSAARLSPSAACRSASAVARSVVSRAMVWWIVRARCSSAVSAASARSDG